MTFHCLKSYETGDKSDSYQSAKSINVVFKKKLQAAPFLEKKFYKMFIADYFLQHKTIAIF